MPSGRIALMLVLAALAAGQASSCVKDQETERLVQGETMTFTCSFDDAMTKVGISNEGKVTWEPGDQILVHGEGSSNRVTVTLGAGDISADGKSATINVSGITPYDRSADGITSSVYAAYPADAVNGGNLYYYAAFKDSNRMLMAAYNVGDKLVFHNCCGVISFTVSGDYDSYVFSGNEGETIGYGTYEAKIVYQNGKESANYNHYTVNPLSSISGKVKADGSTTNFIYIPRGAELNSGFTLKLMKDGQMVKKAYSEKPLAVGRNCMKRLGSLDSHLSDPGEGDTHQSTIPTEGAIDLCSEGTANCYVVYDPGVYKFKAVKGNSASILGNIASVDVIWETWCGSVEVTAGSVVSAVDFQEGWIYFQVPESFHAGNALLAAKNSSGDVIWSWHVWLSSTTVYASTSKLSNHEVMDRNLGALQTTLASGEVNPASFGLLYQWGRKDPFPGMGSAQSTAVTKVAGAATSILREQVDLAFSIANPTVFPTLDNSNWLAADDETLWGGTSGTKTIYDPCPPGYKVPRRTDAGALFTDLSGVAGWADNNTQGWFQIGDPAIVFPYSGYIDDYITKTGSYSYPGQRMMFWSADGSAAKAYAQDVRLGVSSVKSNPKARGGSVRCISEQAAPFVNEPGMPVMGSYTRTEFTEAQMGELSGLCFSKDGDFMWGVGDGGVLYKIGFDMSVSVQMDKAATYETDLEGITLDPSSNDLYVCTEPQKIKKIAAPGYNSISTLFLVDEAVNMGNSGLEGITYYKDGVIYTGSQSGATLWAYNLDGTKLWKKQLGAIASDILEVGDLYYDASTDLLWVSDSEAFKLFVFDGAVTTLKAMYDIKFIGNPEAVLVDHARSCVWVGDDRGSSSRIYKIAFTGLDK